MLGPSHRVAGVAAWAAVVAATGTPAVAAVSGVVVAGAAAHGRLSPDMDRYPLLGKLCPGGHRGITHFWPVLAVFAAAAYLAGPQWWWLPAAAGVAWASHIVTDGVFGRIPVWRRRGKWLYRGCGLRTGGLIERCLAVPVFAAGGLWCLWLVSVPHLTAVTAR